MFHALCQTSQHVLEVLYATNSVISSEEIPWKRGSC
jgi:hypothetical protein